MILKLERKVAHVDAVRDQQRSALGDAHRPQRADQV
jgi:hypothetical protein